MRLFWVKNGRQEKRPFPGLLCAKGENGWDEAWGGEDPCKSMRNSARKQQKEQFSRSYREEKKIWQEILLERWSTSFWAN